MSTAVSVVMPVWNGEEYLAESIDSILGQTFKDFELIVVDDGSTDRTLEILGSYRDERLRVHRRDHGGIVLALNYGLEVAEGKWIARQDADDISLPHRLETQWRMVNAHPQSVLCFSAVQGFGVVPEEYRPTRIPRTRSMTAMRLCFHSPIAHSTVMFRKQEFLAAGGYRPEERHAEDYAAWGRLLERGPFEACPEALVRLRMHARSVSKQNLEAQLALTKQIAVDHCARYMRLTQGDAERAFRVLTRRLDPSQRGEWWWFVTRAVPRLRWQSVEMWIWLLAQWLKPTAQKR